MRDELNPLVPPSAPVNGVVLVFREPRWPVLSRACTYGLIANAASVPIWFLVSSVLVAMRSTDISQIAVNLVDVVEDVLGIWVVFGWPLMSLGVLIYTVVVDRHTRWWRTKSAIAAVMLALSLIGFGVLIFAIATKDVVSS